MDKQLSISVTITQNPVTMEYTVSFGGAYSDSFTGAGSISDPLCIKNYSSPMLPETGGCGTAVFYTIGGILIISAAVLWISAKRRKEAQASD